MYISLQILHGNLCTSLPAQPQKVINKYSVFMYINFTSTLYISSQILHTSFQSIPAHVHVHCIPLLTPFTFLPAQPQKVSTLFSYCTCIQCISLFKISMATCVHHYLHNHRRLLISTLFSCTLILLLHCISLLKFSILLFNQYRHMYMYTVYLS